MAYQNIIFEKDRRVAVLTVNRPEKRNALNLATRREILETVTSIEKDPDVRVLVVTGAGDKAFISGSDLNEFGRMSPLECYDFVNTYGQRLYSRLEELDIPVIAMINGLCLGGGCEVALACDIRIASDNAKFGQPEILLGVIPGGGATQRLPRLVGQGAAREIIFTGDIIDATEAWRIGLVNRVVPAGELKKVTMEMAQKIAARGSLSLRMAKRALRMSQEIGVTAGLAFEALAETAAFCSPDRKEGVDAFFEKRQPAFHDKEKGNQG